MRIDIFSIFPSMFEGPFSESIVRRALDTGKVKVRIHNIRDWAMDRHHTTDDYPYGGGPGMVMKPEPIFAAVEAVAQQVQNRGVHILNEPEQLPVADNSGIPPKPKIILMTPQGRPFKQEIALELSKERWLAFICGRYEGVDERVREHLADDEISIGDYVLTGGELPAMVVIDAVVRLIPGVVEEESIVEESHTSGLLEYPQYTRPADFRGWKVPEILLSGNHGEVDKWRRQQSILRTSRRRPDMLRSAELTDDERRKIEEA